MRADAKRKTVNKPQFTHHRPVETIQNGEEAMKKFFIRIIALILALVTAAGLSGCASSDRGTPDPEPEKQEETAAEGKRIYFASPLFSAGEREYNLKIVGILESYGYEVFLPQRDGFLAPDLAGLTEEEKLAKIFEKDKEEVLKADILFFLLDGRVPDEGACVELGMAYAWGKRCYGLKSDARSIELDMDLNPMIPGCFVKIFYDLDGEKLLESLEAYLKDNQL